MRFNEDGIATLRPEVWLSRYDAIGALVLEHIVCDPDFTFFDQDEEAQTLVILGKVAGLLTNLEKRRLQAVIVEGVTNHGVRAIHDWVYGKGMPQYRTEMHLLAMLLGTRWPKWGIDTHEDE